MYFRYVYSVYSCSLHLERLLVMGDQLRCSDWRKNTVEVFPLLLFFFYRYTDFSDQVVDNDEDEEVWRCPDGGEDEPSC